MRRMLIVVSVVAMLAQPAMAADLWWAVSFGSTGTGSSMGYGAAWNYPTEQEAIDAASMSCKKKK